MASTGCLKRKERYDRYGHRKEASQEVIANLRYLRFLRATVRWLKIVMVFALFLAAFAVKLRCVLCVDGATRSLQQSIEQQFEGAVGLGSVLGPEPDENDPTLALLGDHHPGLLGDVVLADEPTALQ